MTLRPKQRKAADEARDDQGRWTSEGGGEGEHEISQEDLDAFQKHDDKYAGHVEKIESLHDAASDHIEALEKIHKDLGKAVEKANEHLEAMNQIRTDNGLDELDKDGSSLEHGENLHESLGDAIDKVNEHLTEKYGHGQKRSLTLDFFESAREFKFVTDGLPLGEFKGYGAVFGNQDSHGDVIAPGAFKDNLAQRKAEGRGVPMHVMHGFFGGDGLPAGVFKSIEEDDKGLRVHGKISGMDTDVGKMHYARVKDGAYGGLSIGYTVPEGGAVAGKNPGEPKRLLKKINLHEISLVDEPSNAQARFDEMKAEKVAKLQSRLSRKAVLSTPQSDKAAASVAAAMALHKSSMSGGDSPTADERSALFNHLQDAHEHLTGSRMPAGMKAVPKTIREFEDFLRDGGLSNSQARAIAEHGFKASHQPREEGRGQADETDAKAALASAAEALSFL